MRCALALLALLLASPAALAWSGLGHRLVGDLAERHVRPATERAIRALLAGEPVPTLAGISDWADGLRDSDPAYFRRTARWHYVNLGTDCDYRPPRDCVDGQCVIGAIDAQRAVLGNPHADVSQRREALKFLVHLVADAHQPLHAGGREDKGGNRFQVSLRTDLPPPAFARDRYAGGVMGTNLHAVWDYYLLATPRLSEPAYADRLDAMPPPRDLLGADPSAWAVESCRLAAVAYPPKHGMDHVYLDEQRPRAERQIQLAAFRLAHLLDTTLGPAGR